MLRNGPLYSRPGALAYIKAMVPHYHHTPTETQSQIGRGTVPHRSECPQVIQDTVKLHSLVRPDLENNFSGRETDASGKLSKLPSSLSPAAEMELTPISANSFLLAGFYPWVREDKSGIRTTQSWRRKLFLGHTPSWLYVSWGKGC